MLVHAYVSRTWKMGAEESEVPHSEFQVNLGYKDKREDIKREKKHSENKIHSFFPPSSSPPQPFFYLLYTLLSKPNELFSSPTVLEFWLL